MYGLEIPYKEDGDLIHSGRISCQEYFYYFVICLWKKYPMIAVLKTNLKSTECYRLGYRGCSSSKCEIFCIMESG
jgi:hypothetical protein